MSSVSKTNSLTGKFFAREKHISRDVTIEVLRSELQLQFDRFSTRVVSEDMAPLMKQVTEDVLKRHLASLRKRKSGLSSNRRGNVDKPSRLGSWRRQVTPDSEMGEDFTVKEDPTDEECYSSGPKESEGYQPKEPTTLRFARGQQKELVRAPRCDRRTLIQNPKSEDFNRTYSSDNDHRASTITTKNVYALLHVGDDSHSSDEDEHECHLWKLVRSNTFDYIMCVCIMLNAVLLGSQTDYCARNSSAHVPKTFAIINNLFCGIFVLELALKIPAFGATAFFTGNRWEHNVFDFVVVCLQVIETLADMLSFRTGAELRGLRIMKLLRYSRFLRILRFLRASSYSAPLSYLIHSIRASLVSLSWVMLLVILITFAASIPLTQVATDYKSMSISAEFNHDLERFYGSVDKTMVALYQAMVEGLDWDELMRPLVEHISPWWAVFFVTYSALTILGMMNVVTACFVDSAVVTAEEIRKRQLLQNMRTAFMGEGSDKRKEIDWKTFELQMLTNPDMKSFLKNLDLVPADAHQLFMLMDQNGDQTLDSEELIIGLSRLHGVAKAVDLAALMYHFSRVAGTWESNFKKIQHCFAKMDVNLQSAVQKQDFNGLAASLSDLAAQLASIEYRLNSFELQDPLGMGREEFTVHEDGLESS